MGETSFFEKRIEKNFIWHSMKYKREKKQIALSHIYVRIYIYIYTVTCHFNENSIWDKQIESIVCRWNKEIRVRGKEMNATGKGCIKEKRESQNRIVPSRILRLLLEHLWDIQLINESLWQPQTCAHWDDEEKIRLFQSVSLLQTALIFGQRDDNGLARLMNGCLRSSEVSARTWGSMVRQRWRKFIVSAEMRAWDSAVTVGGSSCMAILHIARKGCSLMYGGEPSIISIIRIPND